MNNDVKILKILESLVTGQNSLQAEVKDLKHGQNSLQAEVKDLKHSQQEQKKKIDNLQQDVAHISTAIKILPTKQDLETTVETIVEAAKTELKADILGLGVKLIGHRQRIENLEEKEGISRKN